MAMLFLYRENLSHAEYVEREMNKIRRIPKKEGKLEEYETKYKG